jgi:hypothetical protein
MIVLEQELTTYQLVRRLALNMVLQALFTFFSLEAWTTKHKDVISIILCTFGAVVWTLNVYVDLKNWKKPR